MWLVAWRWMAVPGFQTAGITLLVVGLGYTFFTDLVRGTGSSTRPRNGTGGCRGGAHLRLDAGGSAVLRYGVRSGRMLGVLGSGAARTNVDAEGSQGSADGQRYRAPPRTSWPLLSTLCHINHEIMTEVLQDACRAITEGYRAACFHQLRES
jgi:hypothetical protein